MLFKEYELVAKSGLFDATFYLASNPDVAAQNIDPLLHYLEKGAAEGRAPRQDFDAAFYLEQCRLSGEVPANPLLHFVSVGSRRGLKTRPPAVAEQAVKASEDSLLDLETGVLVSVDKIAVQTMSNDTFKLAMEGWAIAEEPVVEISLSVGESVLGYAIYGLPRPDVAAAHAKYEKVDQSGFSLVVDPLPDDLSDKVELTLAVQLVSGKICRRVLHVDIASLEAPTQPSESITRSSAARRRGGIPPLRLEVDDLDINARAALTVSGWAVCFLNIETVRIFVGDAYVGPAEFGRIRDDVANACPEYPHARQSGFVFSADVARFGPGHKIVKVQAVALGGATREVLFPVVIPEVAVSLATQSELHFHCDEIRLSTGGRLHLQGWAVCAAPTESIALSIDGTEIGMAKLEIDRPDVGNLFHQFPHARGAGFGFGQSLGRQFTPGEHIVVLRVRDRAAFEREVPLLINAVASAEDVSTDASTGTGQGDPERAIFIDLPKVVNGAADSSVASSLSIAGWGLAKAGVKAVNIAVDGVHISHAHYGVRREDVGSAFPHRSDALMSGFAALIPNWVLPKGKHTMCITLLDNTDKTESLEFSIQVEDMPEGEGPWSLRRKVSLAEVDLQMRVLVGLKWKPGFRIVIRLDDGEDAIQNACLSLASLRAQTYTDWRALILTTHRGTGNAAGLRERILSGFEDIADQVQISAYKPSQGFAALACGKKGAHQSLLVAPISAGDQLGCDALIELAIASGTDRNVDFLYCDERRISPVTKAADAYFKPDWSPDLLLSTNYIGRLWCAEVRLLERARVTVGDWFELGDYELVLRATESAKSICHLPKVLCQRGQDRLDAAASERKALARALERRGIKGTITKGCAAGIYRIRRKKVTRGLVSIIIPTCAARGLVKTCLDTLREKTAYRNYEIICIENIPQEKQEWKLWLRENADKVLETFEPFNWSRYNNLCAAQASGEFLLFLNDDIEVIEPNWLDTLLEQAERPEVGVVGPQLLYGDRSVQHAGLALTAIGKARHIFRHAQSDDPGYFGLALTERNVIGVTGACLLTRREVFEAVGRFDEAHTVINNDLDYCLKTWHMGYLNIYTPHAQMIHHELASRGELGDDYDSSAFVGEWRDVFLKGDPYLNPNLSRNFDDLSPEREPVAVVCAGHPLMARESVRKILVLKLDHIGDCITALPALRRLKGHFPNARFSVLANRATKSIWAMEPVIEEILEFDFFHARSGLGKKELTEEELLALRERLQPKRFDLAIDLRKSPDTRQILQYTGARYLAGFDHRGQCPWLDIALEWEGDPRYTAKRQHVADDLVNLVDTVAASCETDRSIVVPDPLIALTLPAEEQRQIFAKRVVCIHPASGTEMRQWPPEYFAELIDLIVADQAVNAVVIGGPDEMRIAQKVLDHVNQKGSVFCLIGKLKLSELPTLISRCALFVGNNSGPKHISAALGVPTIGVHSGVIDSHEWGPLGPSAVAIRRDMSCSPCYIEKRGDCPKDLACMTGLGPGEVYRLSRKMLAICASAST